MKKLLAGVVLGAAVILTIAGCASSSPSTAASKPAPKVTVTVTATPTPTPTPTPTTPPESALVSQIKQTYPGYPLIVNVSSLDYRVANTLNLDNLVNGQVVAMAPGIYTPYNPAVTDLDAYIDTAPIDGDCVLMHTLFPDRGGECWDGVQRGSQEPR